MCSALDNTSSETRLGPKDEGVGGERGGHPAGDHLRNQQTHEFPGASLGHRGVVVYRSRGTRALPFICRESCLLLNSIHHYTVLS